MESSSINFEKEVETTIKLLEDHVKLDGEVVKDDENCNQSGTTGKRMDKMATSCAMEIFSGELWEPILDLMEDSEDILNVFRAFPELDELFQSKKAYWLFDQVLPHLIKYLTVKKTGGDDHNWTYSRELLQLRGVSKRWKEVVEMSLEDHLDRHPCPPLPSSSAPIHQRKPIALHENHFNSRRMSRYNLGATLFQTSEQVDQFLETMTQTTPYKNPFPGSSVVIKPNIQWYSFSDLLLKKAVELFQYFGDYVVTLEITLWDRMSSISNLQLCQAVLECLYYLPNLKSLTLKGGLRSEISTITDKKFGNEYPENIRYYPDLPALENFVCMIRYKDGELSWITRLFEAYGRNDDIRKLGIQHDKYWSSSLSCYLTTLTELYLFVDYDCCPNLEKIEEVLRSLPNAGNLKKFGLSCVPLPVIGDEAVDITKLIDMLAGGDFQIETLVLENLVLMEGALPEDGDKLRTLSSVNSLCLQDDKKLSYDFLKMLPKLRWLTIYMQLENNEYTQDYEGNMERWELEGEGDGIGFAKTLRKYLLQAKYGILEERQDFGGLWRGLPEKLEMISASVEQAFRYVVDVQFVRECGGQAFLGWRLEDNEEDGGGSGEGCVVA